MFDSALGSQEWEAWRAVIWTRVLSDVETCLKRHRARRPGRPGACLLLALWAPGFPWTVPFLGSQDTAEPVFPKREAVWDPVRGARVLAGEAGGVTAPAQADVGAEEEAGEALLVWSPASLGAILVPLVGCGCF